MIEINLLPEELRKRFKPLRFNLPVKNIRNAALLVSAVFLLAHIFFPILIFINSFRLKLLKEAFVKIEPQREQIDEIRGQLQKLKSLDELFQRIGRQRLSLAVRLNIISDYLPQGVWLEELSLSKEIWKIKGSCISGLESEMSQIGKFLDALKSAAASGKDFANLELVSVQRRKLGPTELVDFVFGSKPKSQAAGIKK